METTSDRMINSVVFMGTPQFAVPLLQVLSNSKYCPELVVTQPDRPKGRNRKLHSPQVKIAALELGIPVIQPEDVNNPVAIEQIASVSPDIIVTTAYGGYIRRKLRRLTPLGCLNLHPSLLPKYRGAAPVNATLFNGETETGNTIFRMVASMDAGKILFQSKTPIKPDECYTELLTRLAESGAEEMVALLATLEQGNVIPYPQDHELATFSRKLEREDFFIDWQKPAEEVINHIRGLAISPGAVAFFRGKPLKIIRAEIIETTSNHIPAHITLIDKSVCVSTASTDIRLLEVQPAGKKIMSAEAFNRGARIIKGEQFDTTS
ncbi:MAG: methionyl-tRNA formyltransferase [Candidatus Cloacimonetes bacterium]|nr:methionyl-tRNA formyltransferase [Candidatus Cloacimonadota bacterium]